MKKNLLLSLLIAPLVTLSQQYRPLNSVGIYEQLQSLSKLSTVMYVAAHPDDENTRLLSYLVHHEHYHTLYLSLTRGDGGQNLIGKELGTALGLIRNYELIAARDIDGASQIFGNVLDFGYSKNEVETFQKWDKQELVNDIKKAIQLYKPQVIICRFPTTGEGGHGQHTASAIATVEAYRQIKEESKYNRNIFVPIRVVFNAFQFGSRSTIKEGQIRLMTNQYNPLIGESYGEMAGRSRSIHRSQGAGTPQNIGLSYEHFELMIGTPMDTSIFEGINNVWQDYSLSHVQDKINNTIASFSFTHPEKSLKDLLSIKQLIHDAKIPVHDKDLAQQIIDRLILSSIGFTADALVNKPYITKGDTLAITNRIITRYNGDLHISLMEAKVDNQVMYEGQARLQHDTVFQFAHTITVDKDKHYDQPYWLQGDIINNRFSIEDKQFSLPQSEPQLQATYRLSIDNQEFTISTPISQKVLDPLRGDVITPVHIVPAVVISPSDDIVYFDKDQDSTTLTIQVKAYERIENPTLIVSLIPDYGENDSHMHQVGKGNKRIIAQKKLPPLAANKISIEHIDIPTHTSGTLEYSIINGETESNLSQKIIEYDHLPKLIYYESPTVKMIKKDFIVPSGRYGYIQGAGDLVYDYLKKIGLDIEIIPDEKIKDLPTLRQYKTIITGVRAYNTNESLAAHNQVLKDYIKQGGKLVVQYNTSNNLLSKDFAPYPMTISRDRVTMEDAPIEILDASSYILNHPNKITNTDFDHWVQERGLYFPDNIDARYKTILKMNDMLDGERPLPTSIITADYGQGKYIYTSLSFFRQIPSGHIGATKLLLNILD